MSGGFGNLVVGVLVAAVVAWTMTFEFGGNGNPPPISNVKCMANYGESLLYYERVLSMEHKISTSTPYHVKHLSSNLRHYTQIMYTYLEFCQIYNLEPITKASYLVIKSFSLQTMPSKVRQYTQII